MFASLVAPALTALRIKKGFPIINAWIIGTALNLLSILLSYNFDFPTGYTLVFTHALLALTVALLIPARETAVPATEVPDTTRS